MKQIAAPWGPDRWAEEWERMIKEEEIEMSNGELINADAQVPIILDETLVGIADQAEKRLDAINKIKRVALKVTNPYDWTNQQDRPYLQVSGAEKIARIFGISWQIDEPVMEQSEDGHFSYTYKGKFHLAGASIEAIGTRSSKDGFFNRGGKIPPAEVDKGDLKKAAYTNCIGNGITRLLGIRNMTWDDLQEFAGITKENVGKIEYRKAGRQQSDIKEEDDQVAVFIPSDIRKQTGKNQKTGKDWTKYIIKSSGGAEYVTFSESFAKLAKEGKDAGRAIEITFKSGKFGDDVSNVRFADDGPQEREPGEDE